MLGIFEKLSTHDDEQVTLDELAILAFTNYGAFNNMALSNPDKEVGKLRILTGKQAYFWAIAAVVVAQKSGSYSAREVCSPYRIAVETYRESLTLYYSREKLEIRERADSSILFEQLLRSYLDNAGCADVSLMQIEERTQQAFQSLLQKHLIEDPVEIATGLGLIAVLGLLPYGFTTRTKKGRVVYRKLTAPYWSYESESVNGEKRTRVELRLARLLNVFKKTLVEALSENKDEEL